MRPGGQGSSPRNKDVVAMPITSRLRAAASSPRHPRRATPSGRSGLSSVLRLAQPAASRLPQALDLSGWMRRAAQALVPDHPAWAATEISAR